MQTRILNLPDALKLSTILGKYISKIPEGNVSDFFDSLFEKLSPIEFKECIEIFTGEPLKNSDGQALVAVFFDGMQKNKIMTLIQTSKEIGFI